MRACLPWSIPPGKQRPRSRRPVGVPRYASSLPPARVRAPVRTPDPGPSPPTPCPPPAGVPPFLSFSQPCGGRGDDHCAAGGQRGGAAPAGGGGGRGGARDARGPGRRPHAGPRPQRRPDSGPTEQDYGPDLWIMALSYRNVVQSSTGPCSIVAQEHGP